MLILEGPQGVGKSTFCDVLGRDWFANLNLCFKGGMKEVIPLTLGKLIIEVSEMGVIRQAEVETLKMFLSSRKDPVRMCYDKYATDVPRQSILIGTINPESDGQYLRDTTGNRRFWPVKVGRFKIKELERDINQLWAEAVHRFREGENFYFDDPDLVREAKREQLKREVTDPWLELLLCYLSGYEKNTIELRTIIRYALDLHSRVTASDSARINRIMESQGWAKVITDSSIYYTKLTLGSDI
jgi:predicted P-loop ATPase